MNQLITAADTAWLISRCQEQGMRIERPQYDPNAPDAWAIKSRLKRAAQRQLLSSPANPTSQTKSSGDAGNLNGHRLAGGDSKL